MHEDRQTRIEGSQPAQHRFSKWGLESVFRESAAVANERAPTGVPEARCESRGNGDWRRGVNGLDERVVDWMDM